MAVFLVTSGVLVGDVLAVRVPHRIGVPSGVIAHLIHPRHGPFVSS